MRTVRASSCCQLVITIKGMKQSLKVILIWSRPQVLMFRPKLQFKMVVGKWELAS